MTDWPYPYPDFSSAPGLACAQRASHMPLMPNVASSAIKRLDYDRSRKELHVAFHETGAYIYFGVPPEVYEAFLVAPSKGAFFNERIRDRYDFERTARH